MKAHAERACYLTHRTAAESDAATHSQNPKVMQRSNVIRHASQAAHHCTEAHPDFLAFDQKDHAPAANIKQKTAAHERLGAPRDHPLLRGAW